MFNTWPPARSCPSMTSNGLDPRVFEVLTGSTVEGLGVGYSTEGFQRPFQLIAAETPATVFETTAPCHRPLCPVFGILLERI